jgi:hypothetical protein
MRPTAALGASLVPSAARLENGWLIFLGKGSEKLMGLRMSRTVVASLLVAWSLMGAGCGTRRDGASGSGLGSRGSIEVTAKLAGIPEDAIFQRPLYDYATVLKYDVLGVHRGNVKGQTIYVAHYNAFKPRSKAADRRVPDIGGNLESFRAGQVHRMALEESMFDHFTGAVLNKYSEEDPDPIYWAVWTDLVSG